MDNRPIGILDSGVGGLTVVRKIMRQMPHETTIFIGDNANVPYGDKQQQEIIALTKKSVDFLLSKNVKIIIFACNTATVAAMSAIQKQIIPQIVGVIRAGSRLALKTSESKRIAVLGTKVTIKSHAYKNEIQKIASESVVEELAAPRIVPLIEKEATYQECLSEVKRTLASLKDFSFDTLVLGCTHYPILEKEFREVLPKKVDIVDPADQVAWDTQNKLSKANLLTANTIAAHEFYTTGDVQIFNSLGKTILGDPNFKAQRVV